MKRQKNIGLVWKLTGAMSFLLLITTILICVIYIQTFQRTFMDEAEGKLNASLLMMQRNIDEGLSDIDGILEELVYSQEFAYYMDEENELSESGKSYYISNLDRDLVNISYLYKHKFSDIGIFSSNQEISQESYQWQFYLEDLKKAPYYQEIIRGGADEIKVYGEVRERKMVSANLDVKNLKMGDSGIRVLPIYQKIYPLGSDRLVGVIEMDVDVARLAGKDMLTEEDNGIGNLLLDSKKNVLFDTMTLSKENRAAIVAALTDGASEVEILGERYMIAESICPQTGLINVAISSKAEITGYIMSRVAQIIVVAAICWGILAAVTFYFVKNLLKRLLVLDQMMGRVGEGDFTVEITDDRSEDEITRITQSFNKMAGRLDDVLIEMVKNEQAQKDAELRALQAQINPHFLYNTLENMRMQCEIDEYYTISDSLSALSSLFRYSIRWGKSEAPFEMEWENLKDYLEIMKMRFDEDVEYDLYCEEGLNDIVVPKLMLQPLAENCFNHGFKGKLPPWRLRIEARRQDGRLRIVISDNGKGIEPERLQRLQSCLDENKPFRSDEKNKNSIGVTNVKQRIDMICKEGSKVTVDSSGEEGTTITIEIVC